MLPLVFLVSLLAVAYQLSDEEPSNPIWMKEYKTGIYSDLNNKKNKRGLHKAHFVEMQLPTGSQHLFPSRRTLVSGQGFILKTTIIGHVDHVDGFLMSEEGKKIAQLTMLPHNRYLHNDYFFTGTLPDQPFFIMAAVQFKNKPSVERIVDTKRIKPRTDIDSFVFTFQPDTHSKEFKNFQPGKSKAEKVGAFSQHKCRYGQKLTPSLYQGAEGYIQHSLYSDSNTNIPSLPIPFFYIRHSLGRGIEANSLCYLEIHQRRNQSGEMTYATDFRNWTMKECKEYQNFFQQFGPRAQEGERYAFQNATCFNSDKGVNLKLRIGFSKKPDLIFPNESTTTQKKNFWRVKKSDGEIHLKKLCEIKGWHLPDNYETPVDLSFERSGRALIRNHLNEKAILQFPNCNIISNYNKHNFATLAFSLDRYERNFPKIQGNRYRDDGIFEVEKNRRVIPLTPPEFFHHGYQDFPKLSVGGDAVIWQRKLNTSYHIDGRLKHHRESYLIQNLKGETLHDLRFPLGELETAPKIYLLDMKEQDFLAYVEYKGFAKFDFKGKRKGKFFKIPQESLSFGRTPLKLFRGIHKPINWVVWSGGDYKDPYIAWDTDFGTGRSYFKTSDTILNVAVNGNGRYIAVAYRTRRNLITKKENYILTLLSTENGERVYTESVIKYRRSLNIEHGVAFLENSYLAYNQYTDKGKRRGVHVVVFEIKKEE